MAEFVAAGGTLPFHPQLNPGRGVCANVPRFYMHMCNGNGFVEDREDVELADEQEARKKATICARDVMTTDVRDGQLDLTSFIEVENEAHELLFTISFADAVTVTHKHKPNEC